MMLRPTLKSCLSIKSFLFLGLLSTSLLGLVSCGSGSSGGDDGITAGAKAYSRPSPTLYTEVPAIELAGGHFTTSSRLYFNPKSPKSAELYDIDGDGMVDDPLNSYINYVNAANRMYDGEVSPCYNNNTGTDIWTTAYQPDTLPATTTLGTQFIEITLPFAVDPLSIFETNPFITGFDFLQGSLSIIDEDNLHVNCLVLIQGKDAVYYRTDVNLPVGHTREDHDYTNLLASVAPHISTSPDTIVLIAQTTVDQALQKNVDNPNFRTVDRKDTAFTSLTNFETSWQATKNEMRIRIGQVRDIFGNTVDLNARYYVAKTNFDSTQVRPNLASTDISAFDVLGTDTTTIDPDTGVAFAFPNNQIISRTSSFLIMFNKPVVPETVGKSLIFDRPPFNGNSQVVPSMLTTMVPLPAPCQNIGGPPPPLATNISVIVQYIDSYGKSQTQGKIPFRCYPLHQNNLAAYVIDPLIELPGSTLSSLNAENPLTMRVEISIYPAGANSATGDPDDYGSASPVNLGPCSYFGETFTGGGGVIQRTYTIAEGGRYVNAPVCPNALYYSMGPGGIGVVDQDGNGFTTNHPDFSKPALVTSLRFYNLNGNAGEGTGNNYAYGAKANPGIYVGLGATTPVPGVNEGSGDKDLPGQHGMDMVVRDSNGDAQLYPDATGEEAFMNINIADIEIGDFLDAMFFDNSNSWVKDSYHVSFASGGVYVGKYKSNIIDTPPTPNPPPLTLPVGMRATDVVIDSAGILDEGAFVIMGKEVFSVPSQNLFASPPYPYDTTFIHLDPAAPGKADGTFPPNRTLFLGSLLDFVNTGPLAESSTLGAGAYYGCRQQIGNFLFATDRSNNEVKVLNSNSMNVITTLSGFSAPDSVAISSDLRVMYVTNSGSGFLSVFNADPQSANFLNHIADVAVGSQPKGLCVQPDMEDILVCNYGSSSISIVNAADNTVRKTVTALVDNPWDLVAGPRQTSYGFNTQVYHAYISNYGGNNVLVFESGPNGLGGIGYDDVLDPIYSSGSGGEVFLPIEAPRGLCWDPHLLYQDTLTGGCFVAHRSGSYPVVSRIQFTKQQATAGPIYIIPPKGLPGGTPGFGKRVFEITAQWGGPDNPLSPGSGSAVDVALIDYTRQLWATSNWTGDPYVTNYGGLDNNPTQGMRVNNKHPVRIITALGGNTQYSPVVYPDRLYVSYAFDSIIDVINPIDGTVLSPITGLPAPAKVLKSYFKY